MPTGGHSILHSLAAALFPRGCLVCGLPLPGTRIQNHWHSLCPECALQLRAVGSHTCHLCGVPVIGTAEGLRTCSVCRATPPAWGRYTGLVRYMGPARLWVKDFKYRNARHLEHEFRLLIDHHRAQLTPFLAHSLLVPVPLHPLKKSLRGFNQAERLCHLLKEELFKEEGGNFKGNFFGLRPSGEALPPAPSTKGGCTPFRIPLPHSAPADLSTNHSSNTPPSHSHALRGNEFQEGTSLLAGGAEGRALPPRAQREITPPQNFPHPTPPIILPLLRRTRWTPPQASLSREARQKNVKNAFDINPAIALDSLQSRRVVLVDDLLTTGSTLSSCVSALKDAGFTEVDVVTLARG